MDWLDQQIDSAGAAIKKAIGGIQGEVNFGSDGGTRGTISIGQRPGLSWPLAFGLLFFLVLVLAWRSK